MSQSLPTGYKTRPLELYIIPIVFLLDPFINIIGWTIQYLLQGNAMSLWNVLSLNLGTFANGPWGVLYFSAKIFFWVLFLFVAFGTFLARKWGFFLCIVGAVGNWLFSLFTYHQWVDAGIQKEAMVFNILQPSVLVNLIFFIPVLIILQKDIMAPFFNPRLKWWEQHKRVKKSLRIEARVGAKTQTFQTFDISAIGLFLATGKTPEMRPGDTFPATIHLEDQDKAIEAHCKVVWVSAGSANYPPGLGCTFTDMGPEARASLSRYIKLHLKEGALHDRG